MSPGDHRPTVPQNQYLAPLQGDPATQGDVNTVDWVLKNISSACVTARERERERECVLGVMEAVCGCPGWPVCIKPPREVPR